MTVASDAAGLAREIAAAVSPGERAYGRRVEPVLHERFGTASVAWGYGRIDIAERRAESYPAPGALPEVRPGNARGGPAPARLHRQRDRAAAARRRERGADRRSTARSTTSGPASCACCTSAASSTTRPGSCASPATPRGSASRSSRARASWPARRSRAARWRPSRAGASAPSCGSPRAKRTAAAALAMLDSLGVLAALGMPAPFDDELAREARGAAAGRRLARGHAARRRAPHATPRAEDRGSACVLMERLEFTRRAGGGRRTPPSWPRRARGAAARGRAGRCAPRARRALARGGGARRRARGRESEPVARGGARVAPDAAPREARDRRPRPDRRRGARGAGGRRSACSAALRAKRDGRASGREQELQAALDGEVAAGDARGGPE